MSNIDDLDFNKLIGGLPEGEQRNIKNKLLRAISIFYANVSEEKVADGSFVERSEKAQKKFSEVIKGLREERGWTVYAASKVAGIRPEQVISIEGDPKVGNNYTAKVLFKYLQALEVQLSIDNVSSHGANNI